MGWRGSKDHRYLPTLDGWRAIAISLVLLFHVMFGLASKRGLDYSSFIWEAVGELGVRIFFWLSGFLITSNLLADESISGRVSLKDFYGRRFFRLYPAALCFVLFVSALTAAGVFQITSGRLLSVLLLSANYSWAQPSVYVAHFWSLAVEEHFYLFWPVALLLLKSWRARFVFVVGMALLVATWHAALWKAQIIGGNPAYFFGRTDIQADYLLWGVASALLYAHRDVCPYMVRLLSSSAVWMVMIAIVVCASLIQYADWKISFGLMTVQGIAIPSMIVGTACNSKAFRSRILEWQPFKWFGRISYSVYLWQQPFLVTTGALGLLQWFPLNLFVAIGCGAASFYFIERPLIRVGRALSVR